MIANMNEKGRQTKLLAAIAVFAMVVCAFAAIMPSDNVEGATSITPSTLDYGDTVELDQTSWNAMTTNSLVSVSAPEGGVKTITLLANQTWELTGNITETNASVDLNGHNLKITGAYTLSVTYAGGADDLGAVIMSKATTAANLCIDGTTVNFIGSGDRAGGAWTVDAMNISQIMVNNNATFNVSKSDASATGTLWHTDANSAGTGATKVDGNNTVLFVQNSTINFTNEAPSIAGVQNTAIIATNSTITSDLNGGSLAVYLSLNNSTVNGDIVGLYAANLTGTSSINADTVGIFSGTAQSAYEGFTTNVVNLGQGTSITATTILNSLTDGTARGEDSATVTGSGTISGAFTQATASATNNAVAAYDFKLIGVTIGTSTISTTAYLDDVTLSGNVTVIGTVMIPQGSTVTLGNYTLTGSTIYNLGTSTISGATTELPSRTQTVTSGSAVVDLINVGYSDITISNDVTIPAGSNLTIGSGDTLNLGTHTMTVAEGDDFTVANGATISGSGTIAISGDSTARFNLADGTYAFTIKTTNADEDESSIAFTGLKSANFSVTVGSVNLQGDYVLDETSGNITLNGEVNVTGDTNIDGKVTMSDGASLTIPAGFTFTADSITGTGDEVVYLRGNLVLDGNTDNFTDAVLRVASGAQYSGVMASATGTIVYDNQDGEFEFGDTLNSDYTVTSSEYLSRSLVIPEGVTLYIGPNGALNLARNDILVYGTIEVQTNGSISGTSGHETIYLLRGGSIVNDGVIGSGVPVTVSAVTNSLNTEYGITPGYTGTGAVEMQNVSGVEFGLANTTSNNNLSYQLTVTGSFEADGTNAPYGVTVDGVRIIGDVYVGQDVMFTVAGTSTLMGSAVMDVDGVLNASGANGNAGNINLVMANNSTINMYGKMTGTILAQTGDYQSRSSYDAITGDKDTEFSIGQINNDNSVDSNAYITGFTLSVSSYEYQSGTGSNAVTMTAQRLYISGTLSFECTDNLNHDFDGNIVFGGAINPVVAADTTLALDEGMGITMEGNTLAIQVLGQIQTVGAPDVTRYIGSSYTVTVTTPARSTTGYIVPFETAMGAIGTADRNTVTVMGQLEILNDVTLAAGQILNINGASVTIDEDAELILEARSTLTGQVVNVDGIMTAYNGSSYTAPISYDTLTRGTDYVRYCGIVAAIGIAQPGDTIQVTNPVSGVENLTIPQGVTVNASANITLTGNLVIEQEATLAMTDASTLNMNGERSTVTVNGTLDLEEGTLVFGQNTANNAITSTGTTVFSGTNLDDLVASNATVNGVAYTNEETLDILTSAETALAAAAAQDINKNVTVYGTVSAGDLQVAVDMTVADGARASFSSITLANGNTITLIGELTGAVTVQTGVAGSETDSTVDLNRASGIEIEAGYVTDSQNVRTNEMYVNNYDIDTLSGRLTVSAGTATINGTLTVDGANNTVTVASGATLLVKENAVLNVGDAATAANRTANAVIVDGTLIVDQGAVNVGFVGENGYMLINGTFQVADQTTDVIVAAGSTLTVTGTLDISVTDGEEGSVTVNGVLVVGDKPATLGTVGAGVVNGAVNTAGNGYIKAYTGADLTNALIDVDAAGTSVSESTAFYINSQLYMDVYSSNADAITLGSAAVAGNFLYDEGFSLTGYETSYGSGNGMVTVVDITDWFTDADMTVNASNTASLGNPDALYFKANTSTVQVVVSVGEGISLYIDNIRQTSGYPATLTVGTHTVSAQVNPGFSGDITIQFNGQTITNGEFTITADMASAAYEGTITVTASGNITSDSGSGDITVNVPSQDDGMSLTDILLIVLVILILVMAIIVALRLMRS